MLVCMFLTEEYDEMSYNEECAKTVLALSLLSVMIFVIVGVLFYDILSYV